MRQLRVSILAAMLLLSLQAQDARDIVRQSVSKDMRNWPLARNYTYVEKSTVRRIGE
jgi:hypothetical protein